MALTEVELELSASQYKLMGYPGLKQGHSLSLVLDAGVLLPDPDAQNWFVVQPERLKPRLQQVAPATYAFTGQIVEADFLNEGGLESAVLLVNCGDATLRVTCAPGVDGRLPYGTWESRTMTGLARLNGIVEEDFSMPLGNPIGATVWGFRRLLLTPDDAAFGEWY